MGTQVEQLCTVLSVFCGFCLFFLLFEIPSQTPQLPTHSSLQSSRRMKTELLLTPRLAGITLNSHTCNMLSAEGLPTSCGWLNIAPLTVSVTRFCTLSIKLQPRLVIYSSPVCWSPRWHSLGKRLQWLSQKNLLRLLFPLQCRRLKCFGKVHWQWLKTEKVVPRHLLENHAARIWSLKRKNVKNEGL